VPHIGWNCDRVSLTNLEANPNRGVISLLRQTSSRLSDAPHKYFALDSGAAFRHNHIASRTIFAAGLLKLMFAGQP
jgi:hypothetical protein